MPAFKLDENLSPLLGELLVARGHDVATVVEQSLGGASDSRIAEACRMERRCLITADEDFAQIIHYPPAEFPGIVVLRHPRPSLRQLDELIRQVAAVATAEPLAGRLWIVEPGRIRIYDPGD